jgi:hypothetical protein
MIARFAAKTFSQKASLDVAALGMLHLFDGIQ